MPIRCDESRRAVRNLAKNHKIVAFFNNRSDSTPVAHFEVRRPYTTAPGAEARVRLVELGWSDDLSRTRKREIQRELELDSPIYHGTTITQVDRLQREGKLRVM